MDDPAQRMDRRIMGAATKKKPVAELPEAKVGLRMKHRRLLKGLTLKALAESAACSESMLSRIENGTGNPSINTLHRIALALGVPVSGLFQDDEAGEHNVVLRRGQRPTIETGELGDGRGTR